MKYTRFSVSLNSRHETFRRLYIVSCWEKKVSNILTRLHCQCVIYGWVLQNKNTFIFDERLPKQNAGAKKRIRATQTSMALSVPHWQTAGNVAFYFCSSHFMVSADFITITVESDSKFFRHIIYVHYTWIKFLKYIIYVWWEYRTNLHMKICMSAKLEMMM